MLRPLLLHAVSEADPVTAGGPALLVFSFGLTVRSGSFTLGYGMVSWLVCSRIDWHADLGAGLKMGHSLL